MAIPEWPPHLRPRERLIAKGASALSDQELLAVFLRVGVREVQQRGGVEAAAQGDGDEAAMLRAGERLGVGAGEGGGLLLFHGDSGEAGGVWCLVHGGLRLRLTRPTCSHVRVP